MSRDAEPQPEPTEAIDHYPNGTVRFRGFDLDGEMHGAWTFYRADGSLMRTGTFDRGRQVGMWTTFARDGSVVKETWFEPGAPTEIDRASAGTPDPES